MSEILNIAPLVLSFSALVISVLSYIRMSGIAYRQYLLALNKPLVDWASEVASLQGDIAKVSGISDIDARRAHLFELVAKVSSLMAKGSVVLAYWSKRSPKTDDSLGLIVEDIANQLLTDIERPDSIIDLKPYADLVAKFCDFAATEIRLTAGKIR